MRPRRLATLFAAALVAAAGSCRKAPAPAPAAGPSLEQDQTRPEADWLKIEPVRLLRDYVRIDTTEAKGERAGAEFLKEIFDCAGIENETVCPAPGRCNLLARLPGKRREGALLLLNHIDVAEAFAPQWKVSTPFGGKIENGFLYGRGTYDMKSIAIVQALAMRRLKERGIVPQSDVLFLAEADEEVGQRWGSKWLLDNRPDWFEGVAWVLNEGGTNEMVLRDVRYWGIETIQAGYALAELEASVEAPLAELSKAFDRIDAPPVEPHPHVVLGFDMLANHLSHPLTDPLRHLDRVRGDPSELAILPDRYGAFLESRIHWIGPYAYPLVTPPTWRAFVVISVPPGIDPRPYLEPVLEAAKGKAKVLRTGYGGPAGASPYPSALTEILKSVTEAYSPGIPFGPMPTFGGYTTSVLFRQRGFPTYGYSPIAMNITDSVRRHGNDERVFLRDYLRGADIYADAVEEWALSPTKLSRPTVPN